jgi:hypothetical protein
MRSLAPYLVSLSASVATAATIRVPEDQPTIQGGIDAAAAGDTVLIASGTYHETDLVLKSHIHILGEATGMDAVIVDADLSGGFFTATDVSGTTLGGIEFREAFSDPGENAAKIIRSSLAFDGCVLSEIQSTGYGFLGCLVEDSSPTFEDCEFVDNQVRVFSISGGSAGFRDCSFVGGRALERHGATVAVVAGASSVRFEDCTFRENWLYGIGFPGAALSGVLATFGSAVECRGCVFAENDGHRGVGVAYVGGGSLLFDDCMFTGNIGSYGQTVDASGATVTCTNSSFVRNGNFGPAGVIYLRGGAVATIDLCSFTLHGVVAELFAPSASLTLTRSLLWYNGLGYNGTAILVGSGSAEVSHCTFRGGGTFFQTFSTTNVHASILSDCLVTPVITPNPPSISFSCSNLFGNAGGDWAGNIADQAHVAGNFSADPLFCDPERNDFSLDSQSPCLPGNHPDGADCGLIGALGEGCAPVIVEQETWARIKSRYR